MLPTPFTVATEEYFLAYRIYMYTSQAITPEVRKFVEFALSKDGQAFVKKSGFVELSVKEERRSVPPGAPSEYTKLTADAKCLSSTFRFESSVASFDNRAYRDLERVVAHFHENDIDGGRVRVLGFADGQGTRAQNFELSRNRAEMVAKALSQRGIIVAQVAGLGSALPIAHDSTEEGRRRNRRVEIWVAR
jgi:phosphate transport system substrate-binding protein